MQAGMLKGVAYLACMDHRALTIPAAWLQLVSMSRAVVQLWRADGAAENEPHGSDGRGREEAISHQLCQWSKDGFGLVPIASKTIVQGSKSLEAVSEA